MENIRINIVETAETVFSGNTFEEAIQAVSYKFPIGTGLRVGIWTKELVKVAHQAAGTLIGRGMIEITKWQEEADVAVIDLTVI
jgi:hypothetical protein